MPLTYGGANPGDSDDNDADVGTSPYDSFCEIMASALPARARRPRQTLALIERVNRDWGRPPLHRAGAGRAARPRARPPALGGAWWGGRAAAPIDAVRHSYTFQRN
ncbi:hypothetical protein EVAR_4249_1 [Eumeta japonica]|uniref:Uncharacterized protein n=1 Tax=Eumeta variegata TaxID=151549 RepID=A0A4C1TH28_EUMVA|nr:hypothetical protein EVAR_4249_1 [Eumeta japonica]